MTDYNIKAEAESLAEDFAAELLEQHNGDREDAIDSASEWAHETADNHQWVIYYHHQTQLIANNDHDDGEQWLEDCYGSPYGECRTLNDVHQWIAYAMMYIELERAMRDAIEALPGWTVGHSMPGFMPDDMPDEYDSYNAARDALVDLMEGHAEELEDSAEECTDDAAETECPEAAHGLRLVGALYTERAIELRECLAEIESAPYGMQINDQIGGRAYFLQPAS